MSVCSFDRFSLGMGGDLGDLRPVGGGLGENRSTRGEKRDGIETEVELEMEIETR